MFNYATSTKTSHINRIERPSRLFWMPDRARRTTLISMMFICKLVSSCIHLPTAVNSPKCALQPVSDASVNRKDGEEDRREILACRLSHFSHHLMFPCILIRLKRGPLVSPLKKPSALSTATREGPSLVCNVGQIALAKLCNQGFPAAFLLEK